MFHLAYLFKQYEIARYLIKRYPKYALKVSEPSSNINTFKLYKATISEQQSSSSSNRLSMLNIQKEDLYQHIGGNILHLLIYQRNIKEIKWLLDFYQNHEEYSLTGSEICMYILGIITSMIKFIIIINIIYIVITIII